MTPNIGWHGSPYSGIEREGFRLDKAGSSTDKGAFGWGIYFAFDKERALGYRETCSYDNNDKLLPNAHKGSDGRPGQLYRAELPATDELLHWDKRLRDQPPKVRDAIRTLAWYRSGRVRWQDIRHMKGADLYERLDEHHGGAKQASLALAEAGVPGCYHLDLWAEKDLPHEYDVVVWDGSRLTPTTAKITAMY